MNDNSTQNDLFLGEIVTHIAGMQYVDGEIQPGEEAFLERDFDNQHDRNAIRIKNLNSVDTGFIPRTVCAWLSPLWDEGKIFVAGYVSADAKVDDRKRHRGFPLVLIVYLTEKGRHILGKKKTISNEADAIHDIICSVYQGMERYANPAIVENLQQRLKLFSQRNSFPETQLLLSLFPYTAQKIYKQRNTDRSKKIQDYIRSLRPAEGIHYRNLTLFPILSNNGNHSNYDLLNHAMKSKTVELEEVSEDGHVHEILLKNKSNQSVLLPEGAILIGAKQNRVINISILVAAMSQTYIPVSCVERGRWRYSTTRFEEAEYAHSKLRSKKLRSVQACRMQTGEARSNQGEVWEEVTDKLNEMKACSPTESLTDGFKSSEEQVKEYRNNLVLPEKTAGVMVCSGDHILGFDYFGKEDHFEESWEKLSNAYYFDACYSPRKTKRTAMGKVEEFIGEIAENVQLCEKPIGIGDEFMIQGDRMTGTGVWFEEEMCHFSAFGVE